MYDDIESDFWKDIFVHMLHKNMVRTNASRFTMENCQKIIEEFTIRNPKYKIKTEYNPKSATSEIFITPKLKLRLFIQNQIKASLMQKEGTEFIKLTDTKFPNDPFPEIQEFLSNMEKYLADLESQKTQYQKDEKANKVLEEFIKAHIIKKAQKENLGNWTLTQKGPDFILTIQKGKIPTIVQLNKDNYQKMIENL